MVKTFEEKVRIYYDINKQLGNMQKIRDKLNDDIKSELKRRELTFLESVGYRLVRKLSKRKYIIQNKVNDFILEHGSKLDDFYYEKEIDALQIVKIDNVTEEINIDEESES